MARTARLVQRLQRIVDPLRRQLKRAEVHPHAPGRVEIQVRLHRLGRIHVNHPHEPAGLVRADRQQRQIDRPEPPADVVEEARIRRVAGEIDARAIDRDHEPAPERAIAIEQCPRGKVTRRRQRDRQPGRVCLLPPIELFDASDARRPDDRAVADRRYDDRIEAGREHAERMQIAMVVVIVAQHHRRDRRQVVEAHRGLPHAARAEQIERPCTLRVHRIGQDVAPRRLNQKRGVSDERDDGRRAIELGRAARRRVDPRRPRRSSREQQPRNLRQRRPRRAPGIHEARAVEVIASLRGNAHVVGSSHVSRRSLLWRSDEWRMIARLEGTMRLARWFTTIILSLTIAASAAAQSQITTGVVDGTVVDASGAVVPGVDVEVRNVDTNLARTFVTDRSGRFVALQLPPGRYAVSLKLSGFATLVQENVIVTVGETVRLSPVMKVSGLAETVTVTTTAAAVDTARTAAASTLDQTTVESTPILGRKFEDLLTLTPGVSIVQGPDGDEITFSGQRGVFNNISLDGVDYTNGFFGEQVGGQRAAIDITLEAVKQFQVIATGASAEFGHTAGGVVNVITKSGTNEIAGSLFHYQRVKGLTSNTSDGKPLNDFHREQFGGTIGGPIVRDKAFYFLALEGVRENLLRPNLSEAIGAPCPVSAPTLAASEALIAASADCQRLALLGFFRTVRGQDEGQPVQHSINNNATLAKADWSLP